MVKEVYACQHCGAEADMTVEGFESVADVIKRDKKLLCKNCGKDVPWTDREDLKAIRVAIEAEKEAFQAYSKAAKRTKNPKGRDMFQQLSEFEMNHYQKLTGLLKSLQEKGEWVLYGGTSLKKKSLPLKMEKPKGHEQLTDMDALKIAIREEKKALAYYRSLAELTRDPRGKDMYKRLADEESLHEKLLNDQYYSLHNTGLWSWGD
ncbi:MAG: ferritin family protein [Thermodesulfobacteriota bacterium]